MDVRTTKHVKHFYVRPLSDYPHKFSENFSKVEWEFCYNVEICIEELSGEDEASLKWLMMNAQFFENVPGECVAENSRFSAFQSDREGFIIEVGPRLHIQTPFSTNALSICRASSITSVTRIEKSIRYRIEYGGTSTKSDCENMKQNFIDFILDPMTQCLYSNPPLVSFEQSIQREQWERIDVCSGTIEAALARLSQYNNQHGLTFDEDDIHFYTNLFRKMGRDPTTVELFDLAQSNSEHSRHWFFNGNLVVDGKRISKSLMDMVKQTGRSSMGNNIIKFGDNSSAIAGFEELVLRPKRTDEASVFEEYIAKQHLAFTAETHNFPTAISPFSGAATGTGGRIRDVQAVGRGGNPIAGTVGYSVGNLNIPDYPLPWENPSFKYTRPFARPLTILIEGSNGCSDYGNKFGEPVVCGFTRSFGQLIEYGQNTERREYYKPILFSGGVGALHDSFTKKAKPKKGMKLVKVGGPPYRIGVGGGSASSRKIQGGDDNAEDDLKAVQRGDPEMEQKMNRVIRACIECPNSSNPIASIHDQGAGGNGNVLKELVEPIGAIIFAERLKSTKSADSTLSALELWCAEYQESNALLCEAKDVPLIEKIGARERCPVDVVGTVTGDGKVVFTESAPKSDELDQKATDIDDPVDLKLEDVLTNRRKEYLLNHQQIVPNALPESIVSNTSSISQLIKKVLRHPTVCSKRFLTNKVDRSVTGLVALQQCVGPYHTPISDAAVVTLSMLGDGSKPVHGIATSIGEQPIKGLLNPAAGARMAVAEALTNLSFVPIDRIENIKCSANWMWASKTDDEGARLYDACAAMCEIMAKFGVAVDGGKDSLSMTGYADKDVVKAPGTLVVSTYATCTNVGKIVTADLKSSRSGRIGSLWLLEVVPRDATTKMRLGGSIFAQVHQCLGDEPADVEYPKQLKKAFNAIQKLIKEDKILAGHDVSDGGLITCVLEMAIAAGCGVFLNFRDNNLTEKLFNEECGWVIEIDKEDEQYVKKCLDAFDVKYSYLGCPLTVGSDSAQVIISNYGTEVINEPLSDFMLAWEETCYRIERLQCNSECADAEFQMRWCDDVPPYEHEGPLLAQICRSPKSADIPVAVLREEGVNGDREMVAAFHMAGFKVYDVTMQDLLTKKITLDGFRGLAFPGGFSFADVFGAAKGWASIIRASDDDLRDQFDHFYRRTDTFSLAVCNGCQLMCHLGWVGKTVMKEGEGAQPTVTLYENKSGRFESRFSTVKIYETPSIMLKGLENSCLGVWVAHGEGRFAYSNIDVEEFVKENNLVAIKYVRGTIGNQIPTEAYPMNPNGSPNGVAGICSIDGHHLAMMPHPERCVKFWQWPYIPPAWNTRIEDEKHLAKSNKSHQLNSPWLQMFINAYNWCESWS